MRQRTLVDWFCKAGGASEGYRRAGFRVIGVDKDFQIRYPYDDFVQADALKLFDDPPAWVLKAHAHAGSPPCQAHTRARTIRGNADHPDLIPATRAAFRRFGRPYVIENVEGAPLIDPVLLCGSMFPGLLRVYRHRLFECSPGVHVEELIHPEHGEKLARMGRAPRPGQFMTVVGNFSGVQAAREAMGISWMTRDELREAIPPAFTEHIGRYLARAVA